MLDSKLLHTLATVIECQGFEKAAIQLGVTQSAVSQRIKQLEESLGQALLVRSQPLEVTKAGRKLQQHFRQLSLLEEELMGQIHPQAQTTAPHNLLLACEPDSLASWLLPALLPLMQQQGLHLLISALPSCLDEQIPEPRLCGWISNEGESQHGSQPLPLGHMPYHCVSTRPFWQQYLSSPADTDFGTLPAVILQSRPQRHQAFLRQWAGYDGSFPHSSAPTPEGMLALIRAGHGYGLLPADFLAQQALDGLHCLETPLQEALFWHHWRIEPARARQLGEVLQAARQASAASHTNNH